VTGSTAVGVPAAGEPRRRGRRPPGEDTRRAILDAARAEFAARGYEGATLRGIARAAGVDPRLVHHYFDGKDDLFTTAMEFPVPLHDVIEGLVSGGVDGLAERLLRGVLALWDTPPIRERAVALFSSVLSSGSGAETLKEFLVREVLGRIAATIDGPDAGLRASLVGSQLIGLLVARYVVRLEPLASADVDEIVRRVGPTLERYLTGRLGDDAGS
jgi:AcrR family transcriptional regulator